MKRFVFAIISVMILIGIGIYCFYDNDNLLCKRKKYSRSFAWTNKTLITDDSGTIIQLPKENFDRPMIGNYIEGAHENITYHMEMLLSLPTRARIMADFSNNWRRYHWKDKDIYDAFGSISYNVDGLSTQILTIWIYASSEEMAQHILDDFQDRLLTEISRTSTMTIPRVGSEKCFRLIPLDANKRIK